MGMTVEQRDALLRDVVKLVAGLQVPVSMAMPLGTAREPWERLKRVLEPVGWMDTDVEPYVEKLSDLFACDLEHDHSGEVPFEV